MRAKTNAGYLCRAPFSLHFIRQVSKRREDYSSYIEDKVLIDHRARVAKGPVQLLKNGVYTGPNKGSFRRSIECASSVYTPTPGAGMSIQVSGYVIDAPDLWP